MGFPKNSIASLLAVVLIVASSALGWEVWETEHVQVFFSRQDSTLARKVSSVVEADFPRVAGNIGFQDSLKVRVLLPSTEREFAFLTQGKIPDWGIGCALPAQKSIVLRPSSKMKVDLEELLVHELSHVLLGQAAGQVRVPRWFDEGMAMWQSREWKWGQDFAMNKAVFFRRIIPLNQIDDMLLFSSPQAQLAYSESFLAVVYLIRRGGNDVLPKLVQQMASGKEFSQALFAVCGCSEEEFAADWGEYVKGRFNLVSMLADSVNLWIGILLLLVAVYFIKRYRTGKTVRQWETEEENEM